MHPAFAGAPTGPTLTTALRGDAAGAVRAIRQPVPRLPALTHHSLAFLASSGIGAGAGTSISPIPVVQRDKAQSPPAVGVGARTRIPDLTGTAAPGDDGRGTSPTPLSSSSFGAYAIRPDTPRIIRPQSTLFAMRTALSRAAESGMKTMQPQPPTPAFAMRSWGLVSQVYGPAGPAGPSQASRLAAMSGLALQRQVIGGTASDTEGPSKGVLHAHGILHAQRSTLTAGRAVAPGHAVIAPATGMMLQRAAAAEREADATGAYGALFTPVGRSMAHPATILPMQSDHGLSPLLHRRTGRTDMPAPAGPETTAAEANGRLPAPAHTLAGVLGVQHTIAGWSELMIQRAASATGTPRSAATVQAASAALTGGGRTIAIPAPAVQRQTDPVAVSAASAPSPVQRVAESAPAMQGDADAAAPKDAAGMDELVERVIGAMKRRLLYDHERSGDFSWITCARSARGREPCPIACPLKPTS